MGQRAYCCSAPAATSTSPVALCTDPNPDCPIARHHCCVDSTDNLDRTSNEEIVIEQSQRGDQRVPLLVLRSAASQRHKLLIRLLAVLNRILAGKRRLPSRSPNFSPRSPLRHWPRTNFCQNACPAPVLAVSTSSAPGLRAMSPAVSIENACQASDQPSAKRDITIFDRPVFSASCRL